MSDQEIYRGDLTHSHSPVGDILKLENKLPNTICWSNIFNIFSKMYCRDCNVLVIIGSAYGLRPSGSRLWAEPKLTDIYFTTVHHKRIRINIKIIIIIIIIGGHVIVSRWIPCIISFIWYPALVFSCYSYNTATTNRNKERCVCVCVVYLQPVNEQFLVWWTNACTELKGTAAGLGWPCWHPCGENRCWAKISIKSGKAPGLSGGSPCTGSTWPKWRLLGHISAPWLTKFSLMTSG